MLSRTITPGDRIELTKPVKLREKRDEKEEKINRVKPFISQVYDIMEDEQLKIAMPIVEGRVIPLPLHARFDACFFTAGGLFQAKVVITDRYKEDGLYILVAELTSELKKFQRRQYFRLEYTMDMKYKVVTIEELMELAANGGISDKYSPFEMDDGIILDISGGGIRFTSHEKIEKNTNIIIRFNIGVTEEINCSFAANIISCRKVENRDRIFEHRAEFRNMKNADREKLIKFIFETERRIRKRS